MQSGFLDNLPLCPSLKKAPVQLHFIPNHFVCLFHSPPLHLFVPHKLPTLQSVYMLFIFCDTFTLPVFEIQLIVSLRLMMF